MKNALYILAGGLVFFTVVVIAVTFLFPGKDAVYTLFAGILGNFSGSLFTWLQVGHDKGDKDKHAD